MGGTTVSAGRWARSLLLVGAVATTVLGGASVASAQGSVVPPGQGQQGPGQQGQGQQGQGQAQQGSVQPPAATTAAPAPTTKAPAPTTAPPAATTPPSTVAAAPTAPPATAVVPVAPTLTPEQLAKLQERQAREAAQRAAAADRARSSWTKHEQANRLIIVRDRTVDTVLNGQLQNQVPRTEGQLTLEALAGYLPDSWASISGDTARLSATLVLSPGTAADFGGAIRTLKLTGGDTAASAASIYTGGGHLTLHDITVGSADVNTGAAMPPGPGRPFIVVSQDGRFDATDATLGDLGTPLADPNSQPGVVFATGSTGSLVRTSVQRNSAGVKLSGARNVRLDGLTISDSAGDGLVLQGDTGTTMTAIKATGNKANGVLVSGPSSDRPITNITTEGNTGYGLAVVGQAKPQISAIATANDGAGGLRLNSTTDASVTDLTATNQPIGVYAHVGSARATIGKIAVTGGRRGVVLDKTTKGMTLKDSTIASASVVGIDLGGKQVELNGVQVSDSRSALRIERGADAITTTAMTVSGGDDGIVASPGATHIAIRDLTASGVRNDAIRTGSADAVITGGQITGGSTGIDVAAATTITGTAVSESNVGIRSSSPGPVRAEQVDVSTIAIGISVDPGANLVLANSKVRALEAVRGTLTQEGVNELSLPPLNLLAAIGLPLVLFALLLEVLHVLRQRGVDGNRRRMPPQAVPAGAG